MADRPHFALPFHFAVRPDGSLEVAVTEQDTSEEVADCIELAGRTVQGERVNLREFGRPDSLEFAIDRELARAQLQQALEAAEPRAAMFVTADAIDEWDEGTLRLRAMFGLEGAP
jgi:hypothetical protein